MSPFPFVCCVGESIQYDVILQLGMHVLCVDGEL